MRGLAHFIQDVRKATSSPAEERERVEFELVKIRSKFQDTTKMTTYDRRKYVCKLMFITMLGYPVEFGHMEGVKLLALTTPAEKLIGYLSVTVFLNENHPLLTLATHSIYKDLLSEQELNVSLALTAIANTGGKEFAEVMSTGVKNILLNNSRDVHIRKKAVLTYLRIYRKYPEVVDLAEVVPVMTDLVLSPLFGMSGCAVLFLTGCLNETTRNLFQSTPHQIIDLLGRIILTKQTEPGYVYYGVPAPWLQAISMRLLRKFPVPSDPVLKEKALLVLEKIVQATDRVLRDAQTQQKQKGTMNRVSAINAVFFEVVLLINEWNIGNKLRSECLDVLSTFITEKKDSNLRYMGLNLLSRLCSSKASPNDYRDYSKQYQEQIVVALHDPDVSIRTKALDVTVNMCDKDNATEVIEELLSYLPISDGTFKENLVLAIARLSEIYCTDYGWYVDTIVSVIAQADNITPKEIVYRVVDVILNNSYVQKRAVMKLFSILKSRSTVPEVLLQVAAIVIGEFGYQIALNVESTPLMQVTVLQDHLNDASEETQCLMLSAFVKLYNYYDLIVREKIMKILRSFRSSFSVELQQRAMEYVGLIELGNDELLQKVLEPLPTFEKGNLSTIPSNGIAQERANVTKTLTVSEKVDGEVKTISTAKEVNGKSVSSDILKVVQDVSSESELTKDTDMESLFFVNSTMQLESMAKEKEEVQHLFVSLLTGLSGTLYSDKLVEVQCSQHYHGADARVTLTIQSKAKGELQNVLVEVVGVDAGLLLQSKDKHIKINTGETLQYNFLARSLAPFKEPPSIRFSYEVPDDHSVIMKVLLLPIVCTRFLSPYNEKDESSYNSLYKELDVTLTDTYHLSAGTFLNGEVLEHILTNMGFRVFHTPGTNQWKGIAAHATQTHGFLSYTPVVVDVMVSTDGSASVKVLSKSTILQAVVAEVLEQSMLNMKPLTTDGKVSDSNDNSGFKPLNTDDLFLS
ncbi:putative alpha-adaptin-like [Trypanosoma theileri]|uniref:AP-2 complex subunit alpha n=1 Tax=Trypanosoma theileri TaxID=67003 RepID=A0A1X0NLY4_9TRYP|nr:putative alpha-adaptin-like [Trypanosoma theileri]ORC85149.1 putative alpha-adaptin-like [Trypanosoma theileri]